MNIEKIVKNMQGFQEEMHNEFKDAKTFWKHFYKKLDEEIYNEFQESLNINIEAEDTDYRKEAMDLIKKIFKEIDGSDIDIIEVNIKEDTK